MKKFKTVSLADQVFQKLEEDIVSGFYPKGEILTELKLMEELGVSRTPIREALRRLEQERLIQETGKGSEVLGITLEDLVDIMDIRLCIEGLAAYYASKNLTPESLETFRQISQLQDFYYSQGNIEALRQMDDQFHNAIYELCGRPVLRDTLQPLHRKAQRYRKKSIEDEKRLACSIAEHKAIFEAIAAGKADIAVQVTTRHIENARDSMVERFKHEG